MRTAKEIENAVRSLSPGELAAFRAWFNCFDAKVWDQQFEQDAKSGCLDQLTEECPA
jgi:hypothetical protein